MRYMTDDVSENKAQIVNTTPNQFVPKFCTAINFALFPSRNLVLSLVYSEGPDAGVLIDRVVIDIDHAKSLHKVLGNLIKDAEKGEKISNATSN